MSIVKICLDAGHYGKYNRSPVVKTYYESIMNWKLHNYLKSELESYGIQVITTRAEQTKDLALVSRGKASKGCDLFISIHSNACSAETVDRPVGIYLVDDNCGTIDETSKEIAALLAETVREVMQTKDKAQTYSRLAGGDRDGDGKKNDDYYGVLYGAHQVGTAGVIIEHSFHTNTRAANWLLVDDNLKALAKAEAAALAEYYGVKKTVQEPAEEPTKETAQPTTQASEKTTVKKGDIVTLAADAVYYSGKPIPSWVKDKQWIVAKDPVGDRAVIDKSTDGKNAIESPVNVKYLTVVTAAQTAPEPTVPAAPTTTTSVTLDKAKSFNKAKAGTYVVKSSDGCLNLRAGAGVDKQLIETMANGTRVKCYGYYTGDWLYVVSANGNTGFCHGGYLEKV